MIAAALRHRALTVFHEVFHEREFANAYAPMQARSIARARRKSTPVAGPRIASIWLRAHPFGI
jgi:hypothetical protein